MIQSKNTVRALLAAACALSGAAVSSAALAKHEVVAPDWQMPQGMRFDPAYQPLSGGYWTSPDSSNVRSAGGCVRSGYWTKEHATVACDPQLVPLVQVMQDDPVSPIRKWIDAEQNLHLETEVYFEFNSAALRSDDLPTLDAFVFEVNGAPVPDRCNVKLTGHADKFGSKAYNKKLSRERALNVKNYLATQGIQTKRFQIVAKGKSEAKMHLTEMCRNLDGDALKACIATDRRVDLHATCPPANAVEKQRPARQGHKRSIRKSK